VALGLGLNSLTPATWPTAVLSGLAALFEKNTTVALDQMKAGSTFLNNLQASADPGIPYAMLAGNTSIIGAATAGADSILMRLLKRLSPSALLHAVTKPFFLGHVNDIAVSVDSMKSLGAGRKSAFDVRPVACDHLSYFRDPAGLAALAAVL
jgi:hypothetical protein